MCNDMFLCVLKFAFKLHCWCEKQYLKTRVHYKKMIKFHSHCGLGGLVVSALDFQAGYRMFESCNFQTISMLSLYSTCPELSIKWTWRRLMTDSGTKWSMKARLYKNMYIITIAAASMCLGCLVALKIRTTTLVSFCLLISSRWHLQSTNRITM